MENTGDEIFRIPQRARRLRVRRPRHRLASDAATDAYAFAGGSPTTGKRELAALIKQGLEVTRENPAKRAEMFVAVSDDTKNAVVATLDSCADNNEADTVAYKHHRSGR